MQCTFRDMSIFVAAYEERSFTAAAQRENATQSGVSQHMRNLEYTLGVQLFLRERGGVTPTPAAASFYRSCLQLLRTHTEAQNDMVRFSNSETGSIGIGLMPTITRRVLSPALKAFSTNSPNINVRIIEGYSATLTQMVQAGELDCAIVPKSTTATGVRGRFFIRTAETLVSRPDGELAHLAPVRLRDLGPLKLVVPGETNIRRQSIENYCTANDIQIAQIVELDAMLGTLDFVAQSDWVTILPAIMMGQTPGARDLTVNPIISPELHVDLMMIEAIRNPMSKPAARFVSLLENEAQQLMAGWRVDDPSPVDASAQHHPTSP